jgi:redox-sensitive bicupin YhaK (pirin superfamily)
MVLTPQIAVDENQIGIILFKLLNKKRMSKIKSIDKIISPPPPHMVGDGFRVHNFFPTNSYIGLQGMSPFFLLDYGSKIEFPSANTPRGVGVHPHRGFETVTLAYHGKVAHHDSAGNSGVIGEGDVQWMTAASGVLHKEYHEKEWSKKGGMFQMVQLWVNLPAKYKMTAPKYQALEHKKFRKYKTPDGLATVEIIAGNYKNHLGSAYSFTPIEMYNVRVKTNAELEFEFPSNFNTGFLVIEGSVTLNGKLVETDHFVLFAHDGTIINLKATESSVVLILSGEPIHEPIVPYGPFLMNTKEEIIQAYEDLNAGKFGYLEA